MSDETKTSDHFQQYSTQFANGHEIKTAISQYNLLHHKSCSIVTNCGHKKVYICSDPTCKFNLNFMRKRPSKGLRNTPVSSVPDGHWYVTLFKTHSTSCVSTPKTSVKVLAELPAFRSAVLGSRGKVAEGKMLKNVVAETYKRSDLSYAKIHRARELVRNSSEVTNAETYKQIGGLCTDLNSNNPGSRVCLQLDSEDRFFRLFILLKSSLDSLDACLPCLEIDGTFMKHPTYNGVLIVVVAKTGDLKNIPLAMSLVPNETTDNFLWIFMNLKAAGVPLENMTVFSDRGKQMNAQRRLTSFGANWLHIKNCTFHLSTNVGATFSPNDHILKDYIFRLQSCTELDSYIKLLVEVSKKYGKLKENMTTTFIDLIDGSIMVYLMDLHPRQYSVVGNLNITDEEEGMISFIWGLKSYGEKKPLWGIRTTNGVEGENNALLHNKMRNQPVFHAINTFVVRCSEMRTYMDHHSKKLLQEKVTVCDRAYNLIEEQQGLFHQYDVLRCESIGDIYNVVREGKSTTLDMEKQSCSRCITRHQLSLPCRHVIAVLHHLSRLQIQTYSIWDFVHPSYKIQQIQQCFGQQRIVIPTTYQMIPSVLAMKIMPAPRYNIKNQAESLHVKGPGRRQIRRFASIGEFTGKGSTPTTSRATTRSTIRQVKKQQKAKKTASIQHSIKDQTMKELLSPIVGPSQKKRKVYHCKKCGSDLHNAAKCPQILEYLHAKTSNLKSGAYVIGCDPVEECGLSKEIYLEGNSNQQSTIPTNDFQLATKRILSYSLFIGYEEFVMTYYDILDFYNITTDPLRTIVMQETLYDPDAYIYISREKGFFLDYLISQTHNETNELMRFTTSMQHEFPHNLHDDENEDENEEQLLTTNEENEEEKQLVTIEKECEEQIGKKEKNEEEKQIETEDQLTPNNDKFEDEAENENKKLVEQEELEEQLTTNEDGGFLIQLTTNEIEEQLITNEDQLITIDEQKMGAIKSDVIIEIRDDTDDEDDTPHDEMEDAESLDLPICEEIHINYTISAFADKFCSAVKKQQYDHMQRTCRKHSTGDFFLNIESLRGLRNMKSYINDQIIDGYLKILDKFVSSNDTLPMVLYIGSYFLEILQKTKDLNLFYEKKNKTWDIEHMDIILMPVCENEHWWFVYVDMTSKVIFSVDSLNNPHPEALNLMKKFLVGKGEKKWKRTMLKSPQQIDGVSCGAYVMFSMAMISFGTYERDWQKFSPDMIFAFRCYVFNCLIQDEFHVLAHECPTCFNWYCKKSGRMVACDLCNIWTHIDCTQLEDEEELKNADFFCVKCEDP
jgi:Ulp1 protease family, C-terminal catalytic domain/MULE transposase domain